MTVNVNICERQIKKLFSFYWFFLLKSSPCWLTSAKLHHWGHTKYSYICTTLVLHKCTHIKTRKPNIELYCYAWLTNIQQLYLISMVVFEDFLALDRVINSKHLFFNCYSRLFVLCSIVWRTLPVLLTALHQCTVNVKNTGRVC